jgi:hypothetical protein
MKHFFLSAGLALFALVYPASSEPAHFFMPLYNPPSFQAEELPKDITSPKQTAPEFPKPARTHQLWTSPEGVWATNNSGLPCTIHARDVDLTSTPCF